MLSEQDHEKLKEIAQIMRKSTDLFFITGAGISAESGMPTFRGKGGLYNSGLTEDGFTYEVAHSGLMLMQKPEISWKYLSAMEKACRSAHCNPAHRILAEFEKRFARVIVFTQNIDGYHKEAGSSQVIDIHGDFHRVLCLNPRCGYELEVESYAAAGFTFPPRCPECGYVLRPDVVLFGEMLPEAKVQRLRKELSRSFDVIFTIGTTSVFPYITAPVEMGKQQGIPTVEINPDETGVSSIVDYKISGGAVETLTALAALIA